jgi:hypothetical protein
VCFATFWNYTTVSKYQYTPLGNKRQTGGGVVFFPTLYLSSSVPSLSSRLDNFVILTEAFPLAREWEGAVEGPAVFRRAGHSR